MPDNREQLRDRIIDLAPAYNDEDHEITDILLDTAEHLNETAGEFSDKALAEIAYAYIAGRKAEVAGGSQATPVRKAERALLSLTQMQAINRVR
jgi:hypothetical protein